jgi:exosome complex component RRP4
MAQESREIVIPSQLLGDVKEKRAGRGTFVENGKIYSEILGILQTNSEYINVIPIKGRYDPIEKDFVIGTIP